LEQIVKSRDHWEIFTTRQDRLPLPSGGRNGIYPALSIVKIIQILLIVQADHALSNATHYNRRIRGAAADAASWKGTARVSINGGQARQERLAAHAGGR